MSFSGRPSTLLEGLPAECVGAVTSRRRRRPRALRRRRRPRAPRARRSHVLHHERHSIARLPGAGPPRVRPLRRARHRGLRCHPRARGGVVSERGACGHHATAPLRAERRCSGCGQGCGRQDGQNERGSPSFEMQNIFNGGYCRSVDGTAV